MQDEYTDLRVRHNISCSFVAVLIWTFRSQKTWHPFTAYKEQQTETTFYEIGAITFNGRVTVEEGNQHGWSEEGVGGIDEDQVGRYLTA